VSGRPLRAAERVAWPPMPPEYAEAIDAEGIRSALAVPIIVGQEVEGLLYVCSRTPRSFSHADETVLVRLADHAAAAIHNGRLFAAEQTARTLAQDAAENFRDLVDSLDAIVLDADAATFRVTFVNRRAETILGYPREAWYADPNFWAEHVHPDDRGWALTLCREATAEGRDHVMQYRMLAADGRVLWIHDTVRILEGGDGGQRQMRSVMIDITERKHAEVEVQQQRQLLTHLTRVATLGELSGALAHELNQPLTSILSNTQAAQRILAGDPPDLKEIREILDDIADEDRRAAEVIRRLRTLLRKGEMQRQPLDLNEVTSDVLRLAHSELIAHGVTLNAQLAPGLPPVHGDRVGLQQVLLNLIVNACDAMRLDEPAERRLTVVTAPDGDHGVRVTVADRGTGIPTSGSEQVFEPFFTTKEQGLGLGLSICRSIVAAHNGRLWATNNADRGATFGFDLPGK
jgi:PAS domain S-box-containing protein